MLQCQPRQGVERLARVRAEVIVEPDLGAVRAGRELQRGHLGAARLQLLAQRKDRLQQIGPRPHVGVRDDHRLALAPVDAVEIGDRPAIELPAPETADCDTGEALLIRLERLLLALGDQQRHGGIRECCTGARGNIEFGRCPLALVVAHRVALAVPDRREELAADKLALLPPEPVVGGAVVGKDEDVLHLVGEAGAQEAREIAGRRRVETGGGDRRIVESRLAEILEGLGVK